MIKMNAYFLPTSLITISNKHYFSLIYLIFAYEKIGDGISTAIKAFDKISKYFYII